MSGKISLDTNIVIRLFKNDSLVIQKLASNISVYLTVPVIAELLYSKIRMQLKKQGNPIPENDLWIAASCIENQISLITDDGHFETIEKLTLA